MQKLPDFAAGGIKPSHSQNLPVSLRPTCSPFVFSVGLSSLLIQNPLQNFTILLLLLLVHSLKHQVSASQVRSSTLSGNSLSFRERDILARALSCCLRYAPRVPTAHLSLSMRSFFGVFRVPTACVLSRASTGTLTTTTTHSTPDGRTLLCSVCPSVQQQQQL